MSKTKIAAIQMASGPNVNANLLEAARLISKAVEAGAGLVVLPENFAIMGMKEQDKLKVQEAQGEGPIQEFLAQQAKQNNIWLVGGTIPLTSATPGKVMASCLLFDDGGQEVARYDKIHLFDVSLEEDGEQYNESASTSRGDKICVVDTPFGRLGLAICYDLRFPEQFRAMLDQGMELCAIPSAFTAITGQAHWEVLVRARAIENSSYIIAAAQGGYHINGRETHGDSMVVGPWGVIVDRLPRGSGVVVTELDRERIASIRRNFPAIEHRRLA